jgi:23S rRNA (pseudouridine1915-N3)-methyltransferase
MLPANLQKKQVIFSRRVKYILYDKPGRGEICGLVSFSYLYLRFEFIMKIKLLLIGKTDTDYIKQGIEEYEKRIRHYIPYESIVIPALKNAAGFSAPDIKIREAEQLIKNIAVSDYLVLLDERGKGLNSVDFSGFLGQRFSSGIKSLVFIVGGAFGVSDTIKKKANFILSLSQMTFSHQMVRLFFLEQLYRGLTILNNESYHHK